MFTFYMKKVRALGSPEIFGFWEKPQLLFYQNFTVSQL